MPPRDPRLHPALEVARPDDFEDATRDGSPFPEPWSIKFGGREGWWHDASVTGRWFLPDRREIIEVAWSARGELWTETFFADESRLRRRW